MLTACVSRALGQPLAAIRAYVVAHRASLCRKRLVFNFDRGWGACGTAERTGSGGKRVSTHMQLSREPGYCRAIRVERQMDTRGLDILIVHGLASDIKYSDETELVHNAFGTSALQVGCQLDLIWEQALAVTITGAQTCSQGRRRIELQVLGPLRITIPKQAVQSTFTQECAWRHVRA